MRLMPCRLFLCCHAALLWHWPGTVLIGWALPRIRGHTEPRPIDSRFLTDNASLLLNLIRHIILRACCVIGIGADMIWAKRFDSTDG
jgi:hypothetical protein